MTSFSSSSSAFPSFSFPFSSFSFPSSSLRSFSHTLETVATPEAIWTLWIAVGWWPEWDTELVSAQLDGEFVLGATGQLTPKLGPVSNFVVSQLDWGKSCTFVTQLPFCQLKVHRFLSLNEASLQFTHEVSFVGPLSFIFCRILGPRFQRALPDAMVSLKDIAEAQAEF